MDTAILRADRALASPRQPEHLRSLAMCCGTRKTDTSRSREDHSSGPSLAKQREPCCSGCAERAAARTPAEQPAVAESAPTAAPLPVPESVYRVLYSPGLVLPAGIRRPMEQYFQRDLGN